MRCRSAVLVLCTLLAASHRTPAGAEESPPSSVATRVFEVGALLAGRRPFFREGVPGPRGAGEDAAVLFGGEGEDGLLPLGTIDEVIEDLKNDLAGHAGWREAGVDLVAWGSRLVLRSGPALAEAVGQALAGYERRVLGTVTVEMRAVRLADAVAAPGPGAVVTAHPHQKVAVFHGAQRAFLRDYEGGVWGDEALDPVVDVANVGLMASVTATPGPEDGSFVLEVNAALVEGPATLRQVELPGARVIEAPEWAITRIRATTILPDGAWGRVEAASGDGAPDGGRWALEVRVRANPYEPRPGPVPLPSLLEPYADDGGTPSSRRVDVSAGDVGHRCVYEGLLPPHLHVSGLRDPGVSEIACAFEILPAEQLAEFLKHTFPEGTWDPERARIEARGNDLTVRGPASLLDAVERRAKETLRSGLWEVSVRATVFDVADDVAERLLAGAARRNGAPLLGPEGRGVLEAAVRTGAATRVDEIVATGLAPNGTEADSGRHATYLADYDGEGSDEGPRAVPVPAEAFSGFLLDPRPALTGGRDAVCLEVRAVRTHVPQPFRSLRTPHGPVELPRMDVLRVRTSLVVPFGETAVAGGGSDAGRTRLLLLEPTLRGR